MKSKFIPLSQLECNMHTVLYYEKPKYLFLLLLCFFISLKTEINVRNENCTFTPLFYDIYVFYLVGTSLYS